VADEQRAKRIRLAIIVVFFSARAGGGLWLSKSDSDAQARVLAALRTQLPSISIDQLVADNNQDATQAVQGDQFGRVYRDIPTVPGATEVELGITNTQVVIEYRVGASTRCVEVTVTRTSRVAAPQTCRY
jgi:hypothetical protein